MAAVGQVQLLVIVLGGLSIFMCVVVMMMAPIRVYRPGEVEEPAAPDVEPEVATVEALESVAQAAPTAAAAGASAGLFAQPSGVHQAVTGAAPGAVDGMPVAAPAPGPMPSFSSAPALLGGLPLTTAGSLLAGASEASAIAAAASSVA